MNEKEEITPTIESSIIAELIELRHFKDSVSGLWCVDQNPEEKTIEWVRENAFQLT
ncbi:hypothetical protein ACAW74_24460 [Fibrella sp. WM1]|uniref:hypothetical protein n=1 Tax=Fibrella musci TaxID=3242485 RepID=UPI003521DB63